MSSLQQIKLEKETKEIIEGYKKEYGPQELKRLDEIEQAFGAKNPAEIEMWRTVWDDFNLEYDTGIPESYLPEAIKGALGLTNTKAIDAVNIGKEFDLLIEATPQDDKLDLEYADNEETILRLVLPEERPDLYCENVEQYADRNKWADIWENYKLDADTPFGKIDLIDALQHIHEVENAASAKAVIKVGLMADCIIEETTSGELKYILSSERPQEFWINLWESTNTDIEATKPKQKIKLRVCTSEGVPADEAEQIVTDAIERGEIYSPSDKSDTHFVINDPATDDGPVIEKKLGPTTSDEEETNNDDGDDDDSGGGVTTIDSTTTTPDSKTAEREHGGAERGGEREQSSRSKEEHSSGETPTTSTTSDPQETSSESPSDTDSTESGQPTQTKGESTSGIPDDDELEDTVDVEGGAATKDVFDNMDSIDTEDETKSDETPDSDTTDDGTTRFHTYTEPDLDNPAINVDIDAVAQFIEHHPTTEEADGKTLKTRTDTMLNAFDKWAEMNDIPLNELDSSIYDDHRKSDLTDALEATHNIEKSRRRIDDENVYIYHPVTLNEDILNMIE